MKKKSNKSVIANLENGLQLCLIDIDLLKIDSTYQRPTVPSSIDKIKQKFNSKWLGILQVGERTNGMFYVFDGQNRLESVKQLKSNGVKVPSRVLCMVHPNSTRKSESESFVAFNTAKAVIGQHRFRAALQHKGEPAHTIAKWVEDAGFTFNFSGPGRSPHIETAIRCINGLERAYRDCQFHLKMALRLLKDTWGNGQAYLVPHDLLSGEAIFGIALFLQTQGAKEEGLSGLVKRFKNLNVDAGGKWTEIKRLDISGWQKPREFAAWLQDLCGGTALRMAAA